MHAMFRQAILAGALGCALVPAAATARTVAIDQREHSTTDSVAVSVFPSRAAPSGWHYRVALIFDNEDQDGVGCDYFEAKSAFFGRRAFSVRLRPDGEWCAGTARAVFYIERNGNRSGVKIRARSLQMYFSEP